jgi:hypothetical protein
MKKLVLLFAAVVLAGTAAFAVEDQAWCDWRAEHGLSNDGIHICEGAILSGQNATAKCCWDFPLCAIYLSNPPTTCESLLETGQYTISNSTFIANHYCCWNSRENIANFINAKGDNGKGGKKTPVQAPKNKKGKTTKVQTNTKKVTAKK